jgi:hypothetical protein
MRDMGRATHRGPSGPRGREAAASAAAFASISAIVFLALPLALGRSATLPALGQADPKAAAVAEALESAMGGQSAWEKVPYIRFDFVAEVPGRPEMRFRHWWDKRTGRDRVEGPNDQGKMVTAIVRLSDRKGKSFTAGVPDADSSNTQMGYERWVNDSYWLMMPFKLRDPGTRLKYSGRKKGEHGVEYDLLELTFEKGVGLTPGDHYWLYVNTKTHLLERWDYLLESMKGKSPATATWEGWTQVGPVKLASVHHFPGKPAVLKFEHLAAPATMDEAVFRDARIPE